MSRDYKQPNRYASRERQAPTGGGAFKGILYGVVLGLLIAAAVAWWFNRMPSPFIDKTGTVASAATAPAAKSAQPAAQSAQPAASSPATEPAAAPAAPATNAQSQNGQPITLPGKPGDAVPEKRFQFPDILSGKTDGTTTPAANAPKSPNAATPDATTGTYLLAGSFQKAPDAEAQKANLALLGFDATVEKAVVGEKVWYRVKVGPFKRQDDLSRARSSLKENGIDAVPARN